MEQVPGGNITFNSLFNPNPYMAQIHLTDLGGVRIPPTFHFVTLAMIVVETPDKLGAACNQ